MSNKKAVSFKVTKLAGVRQRYLVRLVQAFLLLLVMVISSFYARHFFF